MKLIKGKTTRPILSLIYGTPGVGKSTICNIPGAVFVDVEDGLIDIDCVKTPVIKTSQDIRKACVEIAKLEEYHTLVFDSLDSIEKIFVNETCKGNSVNAISDLPFGKGYDILNGQWNAFLDLMDMVKKKGKNVILIGHELIKRYEDPRTEGYDKILLKVHQKSAGTIISRCDAVLFMTFDMTVVKAENGMHKSKAIGRGERVIFCNEMPAFVAKNRFGMPDKIKDLRTVFNFIISKKEETNV